jgi:hypothetical protein
MAKRIEKESLTKLIPEFGEVKTKADAYKKEADAKNKVIKKLMSEAGLEEKEVEGWQVRYSVVRTESYDEEALIEYLKADWVKRNGSMECPFIKTKEYIDEEVLEDYIYHGKLPKKLVASLDKFRIVKETEKLNVKRVN